MLTEKTIVFVVNLSEFDGKTLKVDFRSMLLYSIAGPLSHVITAARFASFFSSSFETTQASSLETEFLEWMRTSYLEILTKFSYNIVYSPEEDKPRALIRDGGFWRRVHNVTDFLAIRRYSESAIWMDRSQHMSFSGVDQAFALSERSIEHLLRTKWEQHEEYRHWETESFKARIGPLRIHLLSSNKVVVLVDIEDAELAPRAQYVINSISMDLTGSCLDIGRSLNFDLHRRPLVQFSLRDEVKRRWKSRLKPLSHPQDFSKDSSHSKWP